MKIVTRQWLASQAADRWQRQYYDRIHLNLNLHSGMSPTSILQQLRDLGDNPDPDAVDRVIGNGGWTSVPECDICTTKDLPYVGSLTTCNGRSVMICRSCLEYALWSMPSDK